MKKSALLLALAYSVQAQAQTNEISLSFNSGLFSFIGAKATNYSQINYNENTQSGYTNNPYGSLPGLILGGSVEIKTIFKSNFFIGTSLGIERVSSKIGINKVWVSGPNAGTYDATGYTYYHHTFANLYPYLGYRLPIKKLNIDFMLGADIGYAINAYEVGRITTNDKITYSTKSEREDIHTDIRPRIQVAFSYNRFGGYIGYSEGLSNYLKGYIGGQNDNSYARLYRIGFTYRVK